jgi:hypothetical protein
MGGALPDLQLELASLSLLSPTTSSRLVVSLSALDMDQKEKEAAAPTSNITLAPEIWLDILSRCSYFDLKAAQRVGKGFYELTK